MQQSSGTNKDLIIGWLSRLAKHFNYEASEDQIDIFVKALAKNRPGQISAAFEACLNECEFFPRLADVHKRMPEFDPAEKWEFSALQPATELLRPIVHEICERVTGSRYEILQVGSSRSPAMDEQLIKKVWRKAAIVRYLRMGVKVTWIPLEELTECQKLCSENGVTPT